jgi:hypothetical protein
MPVSRHTPEQKAAAVERYRLEGPDPVAADYGVVPGTIYVSGDVTVTPVAAAGYRLPDGQPPYFRSFSTASATLVVAPPIVFIQTDTEKSY